MKNLIHVNLAVFLGLVGYATHGWAGAFAAFLFQVLPIADNWLRWKLRGEWMHTIAGLFVAILLTWLIMPNLVWLVLLSYGLHLIVDLFGDERQPYFWPFSKQGIALSFPNSELYANVMSAAGILGMLLIIVIR